MTGNNKEASASNSVKLVVMEPCPFCGRAIHEDEIYSLDSPTNGNGTHSISCCSEMTCDYIMDDYCHKSSVNRKSKTKLKLIERWNKRAT